MSLSKHVDKLERTEQKKNNEKQEKIARIAQGDQILTTYGDRLVLSIKEKLKSCGYELEQPSIVDRRKMVFEHKTLDNEKVQIRFDNSDGLVATVSNNQSLKGKIFISIHPSNQLVFRASNQPDSAFENSIARAIDDLFDE